MLEEWIRGLPAPMLHRIANDSRVRASRIWALACEELKRRSLKAA